MHKNTLKKRLRFGFSLAMTGLFILAVSQAQKIETIDGVRVVHNGQTGNWDKDSKVSLEFIRTIGEVDSEDENIIFYMPTDIAFDSQGNIYVLDSGNHRIQKFSPEGEYLTTIGNKGQGPAEFQYPISIDIDRKSSICVSDQGNQRIQILNPDGKNHKTIRMIDEPAGFIRFSASGQMYMSSRGALIGFGPGRMEEEAALPKLLKVLTAEGEVKNEYVEPKDFEEFLMNRMGNTIHFTVDKNNNIFVAFDYQNRIEKYSPDGKLVWRSDRELNYSMEPKTKGKMERSGGRVSIEQPDMNQCSNGIALDDKRRIWVVTLKRQLKDEEKVSTSIMVSMDSSGQRSMSQSVSGATDITKTDMYQLEIFSPDGILLGSLPLDHFADDIRIEKDKLYLLDRMRGMQFYEYKIVGK